MKLKAPFPYFGGKSAVAAEVWRRFGNVKNYVEPFFGSGAVLLGRPHWRSDGPRLVETVNDADGLLANFWRAMTADAEAVAHHADWPVNEADLHARHLWLVGQRERITERLMADPEWLDAKAAGWWVWSMGANAIARGLFTKAAYIVANGNHSRGIIAGFEQGWARPLLQELEQIPQPLQRASFKTAIRFSLSKSIAPKGHTETQAPQPVQSVESTDPMTPPAVQVSLERTVMALDAAALAWATDSSMNLGP